MCKRIIIFCSRVPHPNPHQPIIGIERTLICKHYNHYNSSSEAASNVLRLSNDFVELTNFVYNIINTFTFINICVCLGDNYMYVSILVNINVYTLYIHRRRIV